MFIVQLVGLVAAFQNKCNQNAKVSYDLLEIVMALKSKRASKGSTLVALFFFSLSEPAIYNLFSWWQFLITN